MAQAASTPAATATSAPGMKSPNTALLLSTMSTFVPLGAAPGVVVSVPL